MSPTQTRPPPPVAVSAVNARPAPRFVPGRLADLDRGRRRALLLALATVAGAGALLYAPLRDVGFVGFDDHQWVQDAGVRNTLAAIWDPTLCTGNEAMDSSYLPVQAMIYHLGLNVLGRGALPIRLLAMGLHLLNACLVLLLTFRFTRAPLASLLAGLAFLAFPQNAKTTEWLSASLPHGLVLALYLVAFMTLQTFAHRRTWWRLGLATLLFALAVMTKELGATLLGAALLYDVLVVTGPRALWPPRARTALGLLARHGPLLAVVILAVVIQTIKYEAGFIHAKFGGVEFGLRNPLRLVELMTLLLHWGPAWSPLARLWAMGGLAAALLAGLYLSRRQPVLLFLLLWIPLVLTPYTISNFRDVHDLWRYVYEASAVCAVLIATVATRAVQARGRLIWPVLGGAGLLLAVFARGAYEVLW